VGFVRGFLAPFRGTTYVARHGLWRYVLVPVLLDVALSVTAFVLSLRYWREEPWLSDLLDKSPPVGWIALVFFSGLGAVVVFLVVQPLLNAVFVDRLSERVERDVRGAAPAEPFVASTGRAIVHGLLKLVLYALAVAIGLALTALTGIGSVVGLAFAGLFLAYDGFDYPLSRRGAGFGAKWGYLLRHPGLTIGYGAGATVLYLIPFAIFVAPPMAAVGATLAFLETDTAENATNPGKVTPNVAANT
jgi:CysZ protein